jgi:hypothetical protein
MTEFKSPPTLVPMLLRRTARNRRIQMRVHGKLFVYEKKVRPHAAKFYLQISTRMRDEALELERQATFIERGGVR